MKSNYENKARLNTRHEIKVGCDDTDATAEKKIDACESRAHKKRSKKNGTSSR